MTASTIIKAEPAACLRNGTGAAFATSFNVFRTASEILRALLTALREEEDFEGIAKT